MLRSVSKKVWYMEPEHRSDRPALGYICGEKYAFAVDAGASEDHVNKFYDALRAKGLPLPTLTGISHYHWDHSYGAPYVHGLTLASDKCNKFLRQESTFDWTREAMKERVDKKIDVKFGYYSKLVEYPDPSKIVVVPSDIEITGNTNFDLGGVSVEILYCGGPHSDDHLMFFVPQEKVLFISDASGKELMSLDWDYDPTHPEQLQDTIATLPYNQAKLRPYVELLKNLDFEQCVLGHADAVFTKEQLLQDLQAHLDHKLLGGSYES